MKLPQFAQEIIVKLILSKSGPLIQKGITAAAAYAVTWLSTKLPGVESSLTPEVIAGLLWLVFDTIATKLAAGPLKEYAAQLQEIVAASGHNVKRDKYIGPVMVETIKEEIKAAKPPRYSKA